MSAASYINRRRVIAESSLTKVQYPGRIANKNPLLPVQNCSPDFSVLVYAGKPCCVPLPITLCTPINVFSGGGAGTVGYLIYDGNSQTVSPLYSGGNANTNSTCQNIQFSQIIYSGGSAITNSIVILSG